MVLLIETFDLVLIISALAALVVGALIFFSIGIYRVKKDHAVIIEKINTYHKTIYKGWYYFLPIIYRRVGYYCVAIQQRTIFLENGNKLIITYQIKDVEKYHYSGIKVESLVLKIRNSYESLTKEIMLEEFEKRGLIYYSLTK